MYATLFCTQIIYILDCISAYMDEIVLSGNDGIIVTGIDIDDEECSEFEGYSFPRFAAISIASIVALAGTIGNLLLVFVFTTRYVRDYIHTSIFSFEKCVLYSYHSSSDRSEMIIT